MKKLFYSLVLGLLFTPYLLRGQTSILVSNLCDTEARGVGCFVWMLDRHGDTIHTGHLDSTGE